MQAELFSESDYVDDAYRNPMVVLYGKGQEGAMCKTCKSLYRKGSHGHMYIKCEIRGDTNGTGTDHRIGYHACSFYKEVTP